MDLEVLGSPRTLAGTVLETYDQAAVRTATFVGDEHAALAVQINRVANLIAQRTRRGAGNYAVVSPFALTILQSATTSVFARTTEGAFEVPTNTKFVGTLNNAMRVYVDSYAGDGTGVLVGYKGPSESMQRHSTFQHSVNVQAVLCWIPTFEPNSELYDSLWLC